MNNRARSRVAPPGDVFYAFRQTPTRSLSLFEYYKERRKKIGTRGRHKIFSNQNEKKISFVSTENNLFLTSCGSFVDLCLKIRGKKEGYHHQRIIAFNKHINTHKTRCSRNPSVPRRKALHLHRRRLRCRQRRGEKQNWKRAWTRF